MRSPPQADTPTPLPPNAIPWSSRVEVDRQYTGSGQNLPGARRSNRWDLQQLSGLRVSRRGAAVLAGGNAGECNELAPAEGGSRRGELLAGRAIVLLRVERTVFADGILQEQVEGGARRMPELAITMHDRGGMGLHIAAHG